MLDLDDIADVVATAVRDATAPLLARIDVLERREILLPEKGEPGDPGPPGEPGTVDMDAVKALIEDAVAALPLPEKGEPGLPGENGDAGEPGKDGTDGQDGKDGAGIADALIDREGNLVLTLTDGRTKSLGSVVGKDGTNGLDGAAGETFTLDDFDIEQYDDGRTFKFKFTRGEAMHSFEFALPVPIYKGVFREGGTYERGDMVTWGGSLWHCDKETAEKPGPEAWTLAAKRGRDGKDATK